MTVVAELEPLKTVTVVAKVGAIEEFGPFVVCDGGGCGVGVGVVTGVSCGMTVYGPKVNS